jgi:segregation and condensation protein A
MEYVVDVEVFHGPLDLLLYLTEKNQIDIYDIPVAAITDQYMEYLRQTGEYNLELLGEFLIMASYLLNLKSRMLLPRKPLAEAEGEEPEDPRQELVQRLIDYRKYKAAADFLSDRDSGKEPRIFFRQAMVEWEEKEEIIASINALARAYRSIQRREKDRPTYDIMLTDIDVREKMQEIIGILKERGEGLVLQELWVQAERREQLALFIGLLELVRQHKITVQQETEFGDIILSLRED